MITYWTPEEAADWHKVPTSTLYGWVRSGKLKCKRKGRLIWIETQDLLTFEPPAGERVRPAADGESSRDGLVFGAAAAALARRRERQVILEREWALIDRSAEPSAERSEIADSPVVEPSADRPVERR